MRTILILASAAFASAAVFTGPAAAEDLLHVTPPLFRDQARAAQQVRSTGDLTTTPHPVATPARSGMTVSSADRTVVQASAETLR
jgi:hypothetical protein